MTDSTWMTERLPSYEAELPALAEVCVVGAGIAGLTVAHALVHLGVDVVVLDRGPVGGGQTARTSAHLASALDDRYYLLERRFGRRGARLAAESHAAAIDAIEAHAREFAPECEFRRVDGYLFGAERVLRKELAAAQRAGLLCTEVPRAPLPFDTGPALRFANQAEFHPVAYLNALAEQTLALGATIDNHAHVTAIRDGAPVIVELADGRELRCAICVDATNAPIASRYDLPTRLAAYLTYVVAIEIERGYVPHALYWDTEDPYHYVRVAPGEGNRELLIVGGEDHRVGQGDPAVRWPTLEQWARERFPFAGATVARWSGQILEPADGLAYIGKLPGQAHVYVATGDSGNGLTHGTIAGLLLPSVIAGERHRWAKIYSPHRTRVHALGTFAAEAARSTAPYADWLRAGDVESLDDIAPGHGATIRRGLHVIAAYKDERGQCHLHNAKCTHLSGVVRWNEIERTWDCPCHGSRFDAHGRVIEGPATADLAAAPPSVEQPTQLGEGRSMRLAMIGDVEGGEPVPR